MFIGYRYLHYCGVCGRATPQRYEGRIFDALDSRHCKVLSKYRNAYSMTCSCCQSTRTYGVTG
jgi:hypothetical protein